jgi:hypothetical protein
MAHTVYDEKGQARIEISEYLKEYPDLYRFCLDHEVEHSKHGPVSLRHFWIDFRDRPKLILNNTLREQQMKFNLSKQDPRLRTQIFYLFYGLYCVVQAVIILAPLSILKFLAGLIKRKTKT